MSNPAHRLWLGVLALFFVGAGANHFVNPEPYLAMMPPYLPWHGPLVMISGVAEVLGGLGILIPVTRRAAGFGLILLLVAIFPANLQVALHGWPGTTLPAWALWLRLPLQIVLIFWVYRICLRRPATNSSQGMIPT